MTGINTNINALNAAATLATNTVNQTNAMQQLSTGLRINSSKDDAAGLAIATKMSSQIRGIAVATRNANDGISMAQTASSSLQSVTNMLQRMRELSVQSSNATLSSSNRAAIQVEVVQLKAEIDNISKTANFNGIKLFDGSAASVGLQTNINAGDIVKLSIGQMSSNTLGLGSRASLSSTGFSGTAGSLSKAISSGDLIINGVTIASSAAADDTSSTSDAASSAISKAAAINKASAQTGVTATVINTVVSGQASTAMTATTDTSSVIINGVETAVAVSVGNKGGDRAAMASVINAISAQTGVSAVDTGNDNTGIQLIAKDGRNIVIAAGTTTGGGSYSKFGLATASVNTGTYALTSSTSSPITISSSATGTLSNAGLTAGTYTANLTFVSSTARSVVTATPSTSIKSLAAGDLVINGVTVGSSLASDDTASVDSSLIANSDKKGSAIAIAAAINRVSSKSGVTASANANIIVAGSGSFTATSQTGKTLVINNTAIALDTLSTATYTKTDVANLINLYTGQTGVVASDNGNGLTLTAADGRNISLVTDSTAAALGIKSANIKAGGTITPGSVAAQNTDAITTYSSVSLSSASQINVTGTNTSLTNFTDLGFKEGTFGGSNNGVKISDLDLSTTAGSQTALSALDAAINQISDQQSNLGAIQNRLQSAVDNLTSSSTNTQAAQGRIQDTDYSATTSALSRSQIIAQAATAMLAQANQQPQLVLSLLK